MSGIAKIAEAYSSSIMLFCAFVTVIIQTMLLVEYTTFLSFFVASLLFFILCVN